MQFLFDPSRFSTHVAKVLPQLEKSDAGNIVSPTIFQRGGQAFLRRLLGQHRWQSRQAKVRLTGVLSQLRCVQTSNGKPTLIYVVPYDIVRLQTGGGKRIAGIAKALSPEFRVYILSLSPSARPLSMREISPDVWMVAVPRSLDFEEKIHGLSDACSGAAPLFAFVEYFSYLPEFESILAQLAPDAFGWVLPSPFAWPSLQHFFKPESQTLIYDSHDDLLGFLQAGLSCSNQERLAQAEQIERAMLKEASIAVFCTKEDLASVQSRQPALAGKGVVVPNGVDLVSSEWVPPAKALEIRSRIGLDRPVLLFAGANYKPNHEAVDEIVRNLAPAFPQALFVVMGMNLPPYYAFGGAEPGENVVLMGPVSEEIKEAAFSLADVALAPMKSGTGSSLKIPDYIAHGKIVVGTSIGLRGFETFSKYISVVSSEDIQGALAQVLGKLAKDPELFTESAREARMQVKATLDWPVAMRSVLDRLDLSCMEPQS